MNAIILHIPKGFWSDDWRHNFVNVQPMGVFAIANYCNARGHSVRVSNTAGFGSRESAIATTVQRIAANRARVIGLPLHWHLSGEDVLKTARFLKDRFPGVQTVLGGLTASVFARDIMTECPYVDAVIVGDGELPFCTLLDTLQADGAGHAWDDIPNLVWRSPAGIRVNRASWVASDEELSELDFSPQSSMFSVSEYGNGMRMVDAISGIQCESLDQPVEKKLFFMNVGRGCNLNCVYCGGSSRAFRRYCRRDRISVRSPESVAADFERCRNAGFRRFHIAFDPPFAGKEEYFARLSHLIRIRHEGEFTLLFEVYGLPSKSFLQDAAETFSWTGLILSPCFFDEALRAQFKGYSFTDDEMEGSLEQIAAHPNCDAFVYYAITRLERWERADIVARSAYMRALRERFRCEVSVLPIYAEPGSSWVAFPQEFGIEGRDLTFSAFRDHWARPADSWNDILTGVDATGRIMEQLDGLVELDHIRQVAVAV